VTMLSNVTIRERLRRGELIISPLDDRSIQPCSVDVHLGPRLLRWDGPQLDVRQPDSKWWREQETLEPGAAQTAWQLCPGRFYLGMLAEWISLPLDLCGRLDGNSTLGRQGIVIHQTAGLLDPGWEGNATLELTVHAATTLIPPFWRIGQISFELLDRAAAPGYHGRYQGNTEPTPARVALP
jgi:dCTP deaminase